MPTDTFYRLPAQKRERLLAAIFDELSRVPVTELSINRIVQGADISRGSFYQYFRDRDDLIQFLLDSVRNHIADFIGTTAPACHGDPFELLRRILRWIRERGATPGNRVFCTNLLAHLSASGCLTHCAPPGISLQKMEEWFDRYFDRSALLLETEEDFPLMLEMLLSLLRTAIAELFTPDTDPDAILRSFDRKLTILQRGMLQRKDLPHAV